MPEQQLSDVIRYIRRISSTEDKVRTDRELLATFATRNDHTAFTALVKRYGPMVMGICRRVLHHLQDAEDELRKFAAARRAAEAPGEEVTCRREIPLSFYYPLAMV